MYRQDRWLRRVLPSSLALTVSAHVPAINAVILHLNRELEPGVDRRIFIRP